MNELTELAALVYERDPYLPDVAAYAAKVRPALDAALDRVAAAFPDEIARRTGQVAKAREYRDAPRGAIVWDRGTLRITNPDSGAGREPPGHRGE